MKDNNQAQGKKYRLIRQASFDKAQDRLRERAEELLTGKPASVKRLKGTIELDRSRGMVFRIVFSQ